MKNHINKYYKIIISWLQRLSHRISDFATHHPVIFFGTMLGLLFASIFASSMFQQEETTTLPTNPVKQVSVYRVGQIPIYQTSARLEKSGITTVVAQTAGVIQSIHAKEGQVVRSGQAIVSLSTTYGGASAPTIQRQIAQKQYELTTSTYQDNLDVIKTQRELANTQSTNADELRQISQASLESTQNQLNLNRDILQSINQNLDNLESATDSAANDQLVLSTKQLKAQYESIVGQLDNAVKSTEYQVDTNNPPQQLVNLQRQLALKNLDIQEKSLTIQQDIAHLQLKLAKISESLMNPASPFAGVVDSVFVRPGQFVNPGNPIAAISGNSQSVKIIVNVPKSVAQNINLLEATQFTLNDQSFSATSYHVSQDATQRSLYSAFYDLPEYLVPSITDGMYITANIPIGYPDTTAAAAFIPLDAVFQTAGENLIYIADQDQAIAKSVELGSVFGSQVQILSGIENGTAIITNRNVVAGDAVEIQN